MIKVHWKLSPAYNVFIAIFGQFRFIIFLHTVKWPSVLWRCWLGGRKGIRPAKTEWWGTGVVICLERGADLHIAPLMPLPLTVSCFSKIQIGFTILVPTHLGSPGQRAVKRVCVCVCVCVKYKKLGCCQWTARRSVSVKTMRNVARMFVELHFEKHCSRQMTFKVIQCHWR